MKLFKLLFLSVFFSGTTAVAQLSAGDIAFIGMNTDATEGYSFITLTDIPGGEVIFFSDRGIINSSSYIVTVEGTYKFTAPAGGISCGTIVSFNESPPDVYTVTGVAGATMTLEAGSANLGSGDQVYAYQTAGDVISSVPSDATFIAGIHCDYDVICEDATTKWTQETCVSSTSECIVPPGLTNGTNCLAMTPGGPEIDNMRYTGTLTGTSTALRAAINDFTNWETNNSPPYDITPTGYASPSVTCVAPCTDPDVPTVTFSPATVCNGDMATLTISGSLNDATEWHIYTGSCGGTEIGTTTGSTFDVTPTFPSTEYFVRGEGGCVTAGSCGSVTVTVTALDDASFSYSASTFCPNGSDPSPSISGLGGGSFSSSPVGLVMDGSGVIDLSASTEGSYTVTYTTTGTCPNSSDFAITIEDNTDPVPDAASLADVTAECSVTSLTAPTATDNCGSVTVTNDASLPITTPGTTVVTWTYDDGNGNTTTQTQNVIIDDVTGPTPDAGSLSDITAECSVTSLTPPTATDNCGGAVTVTNDASLPITAQGTTVVTWTYTDGDGNTSTQAQNVVIDDVTDPVPDAASLADVTAECSVTSLTAPTATDNCGGSVTVTNDASLPITAQGTTVVTWTYDDGNGNTTTQTQNVVIDDITDPVPDAASLSDVTAECSVTSLTTPTATDNCGGAVTVTNDATLPITAQGTTVVTWTYDDGNGNTTTQTQNVVIDDITDPVPDAASLADVTAECSVTSLTAPTATDNCGGSVTVTNDASLPITTPGTTVVTWTYDDGNGNTTTQTQDVIIDDVSGPTPDAATLADVTAECEVTSLTNPSATDNCGGAVTVTNDASLPINTQGTTVVTWTYTDGDGNTTTQAQNVIIDDVTDPVPDAASLADITAECEVTSLTNPTATDNCGGAVTVTNDATLPINTQGTTVVTWTYDDGNGNTTTQTQNVIIDDVTDPVPDAASLSDITAECEVTSLTTPSATDNCGGAVTITNDVTLPITVTTTITWTYDDGNGNTATQTQEIIINDVTDPVPDAASLSDITAECEVTSLTAPTATDNCGGTVTVTNDATLPITAQGTTVVTWTYTDGNGNSVTQTQNVVIDDVTDPVPDAATLADITAECEVTSLTPPTATDNCGGTVTVTNDASLPITTPGTTTVTWTYDDGNGNTATQTQDVIIDDVSGPTPDAATLADVTAECEVTSLTDPSATDNCGGAVTVTNDASLPITTQGTTVVTWTYTDGDGNTTTQTQDVVIDDVTGPTPDVATLSDITAECEVTSLTDPTATDNCGGAVTVTNDAMLPITVQGTTIVTWTYDDGNGNTTTQTQNVIIDDVTDPVPDAASLADITAECEVTSLTTPTATDNCGGAVTVTNDVTLPITGTTTIIWTFDDGNGNTATQTQEVIIDDVTAPDPDAATLADITAECEVTSLTPPTATDNCGGAVTVTNDATLPINTQGTTVVTWTYTDGNGNATTQTQNVIIDDITDPVPDVATLADITAECEVTSLTDPTATDNCGGTVTVTNDASLPITTPGTTTVTWTYDDGNGNTTTQTQDVVIDDVSGPTPDVAVLGDVTAECEVTSLADPTATDNCGGTVTVTNDASLPITTQGTTVVTWTYEDENGNTTTQTQNIVIDDVTGPAPDVAVLADVTAECEVTSLTDPTATDNCGGAVTVTNDATLPITVQGTTIVTWTYEDENGNITTQTQNVVIDDITAPVIFDCPSDITENANFLDCSADLGWIEPTVTDNCAGVTFTSTHIPGEIFPFGTTTVTYTATDIGLNETTCSFDVNVITDLSIATVVTDEMLGGDGAIDVTVTGGEPAYEYDWDIDGTGDFDDTEDLTDLDAGTYELTIMDDFGCTVTETVNIELACIPLEVTVSATTVCQTDLLILDATSESGADITWDGGAIDGVGFNPESTGIITYTATSADEEDCPASVEIEVLPAPIVTASSGDESYCDGETIILASGGDADTYVWEPLDFMPPVGVTTYTLTGTYEETGCSTSVSIDVTVHELPTVIANADPEQICIGNSVELSGSGAETYVWEPTFIIDGEAYTPEAVGTYDFTVVGTDENGCENTASVSVEVVDEITITYTTTDEELGSDGAIDITVSGGAPAYLFDWDNDGTGDFDDDEDLTGLTGGTYIVVVEGEAGCVATETIVLNSSVGIGENTGKHIKVYPNPTIDNLTISVEGEFKYTLHDIQGRTVLNGSGINTEIISVDSVEDGMYILIIQQGDTKNYVEIVKH